MVALLAPHPDDAVFPDADERFLALFQLWERWRGAAPVPRWRSVDVCELKPWMGWLYLVDFEDESGTARYALTGTELVERLHFDLTGRTAEEVDFGPHTHRILASYRRCRDAGRPLFSENVLERSDLPPLCYKRLLLPFRHRRDEAVDRLLGLVKIVDTFQDPCACAGVEPAGRREVLIG